ncbi:sporulation protein YtxC [Caldicellulosiruptoraceae bacterium PP1]
MLVLSFGVEEQPQYIYDKLNRYLNEQKRKVGNVVINLQEQGDITFFSINIDDSTVLNNLDKFSYEKIKYCIASAICSLIVDWTKERFIQKTIEENYYFLDDIEKQKIKELSISKFNQLIDNQSFSKIKYTIIKKILEFLDNNYQLNFEGFITFRLKEYTKEVINLIDYSANNYFLEREYYEFINLLKYFLNIQDSKEDLVHIVPLNNRYAILNQQYNEVQDEVYNLLQKNFKLNLTTEDILISRIISISPKKVIFHSIDNNPKHTEIINLVKLIFEERLSVCYGCEICKNMEKQNEGKI